MTKMHGCNQQFDFELFRLCLFYLLFFCRQELTADVCGLTPNILGPKEI